MTSMPVTLPPTALHVGLIPMSEKMYAMSSPPVFMVSVAQTTMPIERGWDPCSDRYLSNIWSAILHPTSQLDCQGTASGSSE